MIDCEYRFNDFNPPIPFLTGDAAALHSIITEIDKVLNLSPERIADRQAEYLLSLMSHFAEISPKFRKRLKGDLPGEGTALPELLSLLEPEDKMYFQELPPASQIPRHYLPTHWAKTSGSTGVPLKVLCTSVTRSIGMAQVTWAHLASRVDFSWRMASVKATNTGVKTSDSWDPATSLLFKVGSMLSISSSMDVLEQLDHLEKYQPDLLIALPSVLKEYLSLWDRGCREPLKLKMIRTMGETLPQDTRLLSEQLTGAYVLDTYSSSEVERIATQVMPSGPYITNSFSLVVEILNEEGARCLPGEEGRVVITDLFNYATPLIRYDIGDWAVPCDGNHNRLKCVRGRSRNMLTLPDGRKIWPLVGYREFSEVLPVRQFHVRQVSKDSLHAYFYVDRMPDPVEIEQVNEIIHKSLGYSFNITSTYQTSPLKKGSNSKLEDFVSLI